MADLGTFDRPVLKDRYIDVLDTIRANILRIKAVADVAQDSADSALAAVGGVPDMLNDYMPKSGGRFTGDITTQRIVSESTIALQGLGGDFGTIITAGPWGGGQGAALQLNGALAQNSGFGNNGEWALLSPGHPTLLGGARLLWAGDDLGRWAPIDPAAKADITYVEAALAGIDLSAYMPKSGGEFSGQVEFRSNLVFNDYESSTTQWIIHHPPNGNWYLAPAAGDSWDFGKGVRIDSGAAGFYWNGNDLGRWAAIDPTSKANANHGHSILAFNDTRDSNFDPWAWQGVSLHLKQNTADGLGDGGAYHGILNLTNWSDSSGGKAHQIGLTDNDQMWHRASGGSWGPWRLVWDSYNLPKWDPRFGSDVIDQTIVSVVLKAPVPGDTVSLGYRYNQAAIGNAWAALGGNGFYCYLAGVRDFRIGNTGNCTRIGPGGELTAPTIQTVSDARRKQDFSLIDSALAKLSSLKGYTYAWRDSGKLAAGLIAQDVESILPMAVSEHDGLKSLDYNAITAVLVNAVKELKAELDQLKGAAA